MEKAILFLLFGITILYSHGTDVIISQENPRDSVTIALKFESGEPLKNGKVSVYPPERDELAYKLTTDQRGIFKILADTTGLWILQIVDSTGHAVRVNLEMDKSLAFIDRKVNRENSSSDWMLYLGIFTCAMILTFVLFKKRR